MVHFETNSPFQANWNETNNYLNRARGNVLERGLRIFKYLAFYIPNCFLATCFNPRMATRFEAKKFKSIYHHEISKKIVTPDKVDLVAKVHIADKNFSDPTKTPTVILFNPLGTNSDVFQTFKSYLLISDINVITFDYRGLGSTRSSDDFVIDGESVYQYVTEELKIDKDHVHLSGFSLGGAVAAQVKGLHPESKGKYVGDRPFKSIFSLITEKLCIAKLGATVKKITSIVAAILFAYPVKFLGWEWDGGDAISKMKCDKRIIVHPQDWLIPKDASMSELVAEGEKIVLDPFDEGPITHFGLIDRKICKKESVMGLVCKFILDEKDAESNPIFKSL